MNRGLVRKIIREVRLPVLLFAIGLCLIMCLLTALLPKILSDVDEIFGRLPFLKPVITALLGVDPGDQFSAQMMQAFLWVHPSVLATLWAHEVMFCTRVPAAETDRGTIDFLLAQPISRLQLLTTESVIWLVSGLLIAGCGCIGHITVAAALKSELKPSFVTTGFILTNLMSVYAAVGAFTYLISSFSSRRNTAVGIVFAVLLLSFLLNFLAQFWPPAGQVGFLSVMHYYRPALILENDAFPIADVCTLWGIAAAFWVTAAAVFSSRDLTTT